MNSLFDPIYHDRREKVYTLQDDNQFAEVCTLNDECDYNFLYWSSYDNWMNSSNILSESSEQYVYLYPADFNANPHLFIRQMHT